jgi:hypothetical protein
LVLSRAGFSSAERARDRLRSVPDYPKLPKGLTFGEVPGVRNSKGHVCVHALEQRRRTSLRRRLRTVTRSERERRRDRQGQLRRAFAQTVRVDKDDNIWAVDKGST